MANVRKDKKLMFDMVLKALDRDSGARKDMLTSGLAIEFQYSHDLINTLILDMFKTGFINIDNDGFISLTKYGRDHVNDTATEK